MPVPQDERDEPASVLLSRIKQEMARMAKSEKQRLKNSELVRTENFRKGLSKTFKKGLSNDGYGTPYPDTPSRGVSRDRYAKHT